MSLASSPFAISRSPERRVPQCALRPQLQAAQTERLPARFAPGWLAPGLAGRNARSDSLQGIAGRYRVLAGFGLLELRFRARRSGRLLRCNTTAYIGLFSCRTAPPPPRSFFSLRLNHSSEKSNRAILSTDAHHPSEASSGVCQKKLPPLFRLRRSVSSCPPSPSGTPYRHLRRSPFGPPASPLLCSLVIGMCVTELEVFS